MIRVGIIGPEDRDEMIRLSIRLAERGAEGVILDSRDDPGIRMTPGEEFACGEDLTDFQGFYVADLGLPSSVIMDGEGRLDRAASAKALQSSQRRLAAWNALLARLALRCPVINPPHTHDLHGLKPWEMTVYSRRELPSPLTISTSDPKTLMMRREDPSNEWITKGMVGGYGYTESFVPPDTMEKAKQMLQQGPFMIQERIVGDNVRAFVLDGEVIGAAEVIPQETGETDSRRGDVRLRKIELPDEAISTAVTATAHWGLIFAAVDFMVDPASGRFLLLECNSAPFFVTFEKRTGLPISSKLATFLTRSNRD